MIERSGRTGHVLEPASGQRRTGYGGCKALNNAWLVVITEKRARFDTIINTQ